MMDTNITNTTTNTKFNARKSGGCRTSEVRLVGMYINPPFYALGVSLHYIDGPRRELKS